MMRGESFGTRAPPTSAVSPPSPVRVYTRVMLIVMSRLLVRPRPFYLNVAAAPAMIGHALRAAAFRAGHRRRHALRARRLLGDPLRAAAGLGRGVPALVVAGRLHPHGVHRRHGRLPDPRGPPGRALRRAPAAHAG